MAELQGVTVGRVVHYHSGTTKRQYNAGREEMADAPAPCRAAMIVQVWPPASKGYVNLTVFTDWTNDHPSGMSGDRGMRWETSVDYSEQVLGENRRSWHWPTECRNPVP